jgi:hypothetical protein
MHGPSPSSCVHVSLIFIEQILLLTSNKSSLVYFLTSLMLKLLANEYIYEAQYSVPKESAYEGNYGCCEPEH